MSVARRQVAAVYLFPYCTVCEVPDFHAEARELEPRRGQIHYGKKITSSCVSGVRKLLAENGFNLVLVMV